MADMLVVLLTLGEHTSERAIESAFVAIACVDAGCKLAHVSGVRPVSRALERMLATAESHGAKRVVELDSDMFIRPHALRVLSEAASKGGAALTCGWLWDVLCERPIIGIKCYDVEAARAVGGFHTDAISADTDHTARLSAAGYKVVYLPEPASESDARCLGEHHTISEGVAYRRFLRFAWKHRVYQHAYRWVEEVIKRLSRRDDALAKAAVQGFRAGLIRPIPAGDQDGSSPWRPND